MAGSKAHTQRFHTKEDSKMKIVNVDNFEKWFEIQDDETKKLLEMWEDADVTIELTPSFEGNALQSLFVFEVDGVSYNLRGYDISGSDTPAEVREKIERNYEVYLCLVLHYMGFNALKELVYITLYPDYLDMLCHCFARKPDVFAKKRLFSVDDLCFYKQVN